MILQKKQLDLDFKTNFKPFDRILVAVDEDDSKSSLAAFQYALALAKPNLAALGIVSVLELEDLNVFETFSPEKRNQLRENLTVDLERYVKKPRKMEFMTYALLFKKANQRRPLSAKLFQNLSQMFYCAVQRQSRSAMLKKFLLVRRPVI